MEILHDKWEIIVRLMEMLHDRCEIIVGPYGDVM